MKQKFRLYPMVFIVFFTGLALSCGVKGPPQPPLPPEAPQTVEPTEEEDND